MRARGRERERNLPAVPLSLYSLAANHERGFCSSEHGHPYRNDLLFSLTVLLLDKIQQQQQQSVSSRNKPQARRRKKKTSHCTCFSVSSLENIECLVVTFREHWALSSESTLYWQIYSFSIRPAEIKVPLTFHLEPGLESHSTAEMRHCGRGAEERWPPVLSGAA